jgi:hypothetical protein
VVPPCVTHRVSTRGRGLAGSAARSLNRDQV